MMAVWAACASCTKKDEAPRGPGAIVTLQTDVHGFSGLTRDEHGALWAPAERGDAIVRIDPETFAVTPYEVAGHPEGTDFEAIAWAEGVQFVIGTETQEKGRLSDVILDGRLHEGRFSITPIGRLDYAHWQKTAPDNDGIEGLCQLGTTLIVATELVEKREGRRWAPLAVYEATTQSWTGHWVALTSETGKLAAMDCREREGTIEALAVERHFGTSRILRFSVARGPMGQRIEPAVAADLASLIAPLPNFEGLAWLPDGSAVLLTDNRYRGRTEGPSRLFFIPASVLR